MTRRIQQIIAVVRANSYVHEGGEQPADYAELYALDEDGRVWKAVNPQPLDTEGVWELLPALPQPQVEE